MHGRGAEMPAAMSQELLGRRGPMQQSSPRWYGAVWVQVRFTAPGVLPIEPSSAHYYWGQPVPFSCLN